MSEIEIHCTYDELVDPALLVPNSQNPNHHSQEQISLLAKLIKHHGWRRNIVVSERSGYVVSGHGRLMAAKVLGVETVPVDYQPYQTEADEMADMLADNRIAELSDINPAKLETVLAELAGQSYELDLAGFDHNSISHILGHMADQEDYSDKNKEIDIDNLLDDSKTVQCPRCDFEFEKS